MVAQRTVNALVGGSNPSPRAKTFFGKRLTAAEVRVDCSCSLDAIVAQR